MKERKIRFNFIDVVILLLIAAVVFAVLYVFVFSARNDSPAAQTQYTKIRYVIQAVGIDEKYDGLVKAGDSVEEAISRKAVGSVVGVQSEPYQKVTFDYENGKETVALVEGKITMNITIEATATESDSAFTAGGCEIRVGQQYSIAMPDLYCSGYCIELTADSDK